MQEIIFGPVYSRRFGRSLGIDLSPALKQCSFDCIYCELKAAKPVDAMSEVVSVDKIITALKSALVKFSHIDVITITANGEPTLYPDLDYLVDEINKIKGSHKLLILTNGASVVDDRTKELLRKIDIVKFSLDCATQKCFKKIDRPLKGIEIKEVIKNMQEFRSLYTGLLIAEVLVVEGINDKEEEFEKISIALNEIKPDRVDVGTIDRPPAYNVKSVSSERLKELADLITDLNVNIAYRKDYIGDKIDFTEDEILNLLSKRPQSQHDVTSCFGEKSQKILEKLIEKQIVREEKIAEITFYRY